MNYDKFDMLEIPGAQTICTENFRPVHQFCTKWRDTKVVQKVKFSKNDFPDLTPIRGSSVMGLVFYAQEKTWA